ncbi:hypothetical protein AKJ16_DCAP09178 [Drosera capensis]
MAKPSVYSPEEHVILKLLEQNRETKELSISMLKETGRRLRIEQGYHDFVGTQDLPVTVRRMHETSVESGLSMSSLGVMSTYKNGRGWSCRRKDQHSKTKGNLNLHEKKYKCL